MCGEAAAAATTSYLGQHRTSRGAVEQGQPAREKKEEEEKEKKVAAC